MCAETNVDNALRIRTDELLRRYTAALLEHLNRPDESNLLAARELGGVAVHDGGRLGEITRLHHQVLRESARDGGGAAAFDSAGSFLAECIASFAVSQSQLHEAAAALHQLNQKLEEQVARVSHSIYDESLQLLAAASLALDGLGEQLPSGTESFAKGRAMLDELEGHLRKISFELRPCILDNLGLDAAVQTLGAYFADAAHIEVAVEAEPAILSPQLSTVFFRAVQHALTNIWAHAHASHVNIRLRCDGNVVICRIADDGFGFDPARIFSAHGRLGLGLIGIRENVRPFGGTLTVLSTPGAGTELCISAPLSNAPLHCS